MPMFAQVGGVLEERQINGQPGAVFRDRDGRVGGTMALDIVEGRVRAIRSITNPDKLGHLGPVGDGFAMLREAQRLRRESGRAG